MMTWACAAAAVDKASAELNDISQAIWSKPELGKIMNNNEAI